MTSRLSELTETIIEEIDPYNTITPIGRPNHRRKPGAIEAYFLDLEHRAAVGRLRGNQLVVWSGK